MARPLRFCFLSIFYPPYSFGGDAIFVSRLANSLARLGHEVDVIHCVDSYKVLAKSEPTRPFANHPNVTIHSLRSRLGFLSPLVAQQVGWTWPKTDAILEVFYGKKFDVIHYHNTSLFGPKVLRLEPDYKDFIKLYTTHEHWLVCPMHVLWKDNERVCDKPDCFRCTMKFRRPPQWWRYTGLLEKCTPAVDMFVSPSQFTRQMHQDRGFQSPMVVLPYFVPALDQDASSESTPPHAKPYFLYVGRLEKIKGVDSMFPAFRRYQHADLLIAGTGSCEAALREQAQGMANVRFLGQLTQDQLQAYSRHALAVIVPSLCYEVFPITFLEACRAGTPSIARDIGGLTEMIEQSGGGILYRNDEELAAAVERLHTEPALRREMGQRAYQAYTERWRESVHLEAYFRVLDETARRKLGFVPWEQPVRQSLQFPTVPAV
jgi:glycosyltransferase involved in cell wall biosynthesis